MDLKEAIEREKNAINAARRDVIFYDDELQRGLIGPTRQGLLMTGLQTLELLIEAAERCHQAENALKAAEEWEYISKKLIEGLEMIAGLRSCPNNLMSNVDIAKETLDSIKIKDIQNDDWHPISSAPKDGTRMILAVPTEQMDYKPGSSMVVIGWYAPQHTLEAHYNIDPEDFPDQFEYHEGEGQYYSKPDFFVTGFENTYGDEIARKVTPTHWLPLPKAPKQTGDK